MKHTTLGQNSSIIILLATATLAIINIASAAPHNSFSYPTYYSQEGQNPEYVLRSIARLRQAIYGDDDLENQSFVDYLKFLLESIEKSQESSSLLLNSKLKKSVQKNNDILKYVSSGNSKTFKRTAADLGIDRGYSGSQEHAFRIMTRLGSKRGLDLGLGRGFSGSQAAKHLMGLAAANFAGGPGRRRRGYDMEE